MGDQEVLIQETTRSREWISCRHFLAMLSSLGFCVVYALRVNLSVALVAMVNSSYVDNLSNSSSFSEQCPGGRSDTDLAVKSVSKM